MSVRTAASGKSAWRGYEYYCGDKVRSVIKLDDTHYGGAVVGSAAEPYNVVIDLEHTRRSDCDCPFADGRRVCKHMVALFFAAFPEEATQYKAEIDSAADEEERYREELTERIERYLNKLTKAELRELLLSLICELPEYELDRFTDDYYADADEYSDEDENYDDYD